MRSSEKRPRAAAVFIDTYSAVKENVEAVAGDFFFFNKKSAYESN